ncbi:MAG: cellulase family glycosylhydrolase [Anaerolinea sp.]|nr:cellulase family glycosylhydrolase [Anaerolinea sp.]
MSLIRWIIRLLLVVWLIGAFVPAPPRSPLEVPDRVVETVQPHVCMHTRLIDEVEEWKIQRTLQLVREMGANTIVEFFPWAYIERAPDQYDWSSVDRIVAHARNQGIHIIARMGLVPAWARQTPDDPRAERSTLNTLPPESFDDFARFAADFAARYATRSGGVIDHLIIWNEPNLAFEWGYQQVDPAGYVDLLRAVYAPIHAANPNAVVLAAGLAPTLEPEGSPNGLNDVLYLERLYQNGAANYFDALAVHTYGFTEPADAAPDPLALNFRRAELLRDVMLRYDDADTPVYITEMGWNDHPRWTKAVSAAQRVTYTLDALRMVADQWNGTEKACLWVFRYPYPTFSYPDNFTFANIEFQLRPIYYAVQAYARGWEDQTQPKSPTTLTRRSEVRESVAPKRGRGMPRPYEATGIASLLSPLPEFGEGRGWG